MWSSDESQLASELTVGFLPPKNLSLQPTLWTYITLAASSLELLVFFLVIDQIQVKSTLKKITKPDY